MFTGLINEVPYITDESKRKVEIELFHAVHPVSYGLAEIISPVMEENHPYNWTQEHHSGVPCIVKIVEVSEYDI
jgi:hypothetical protein